MKGTKQALEYHDTVFTKLGVKRGWWSNWVVPTVRGLKGEKCEACRSKDNLDIHHSSHKIVNINTLMLLCRKCHINWHKNNEVESPENIT